MQFIREGKRGGLWKCKSRFYDAWEMTLLVEPWVDKRLCYVCWRMELRVLLDEPWADKKRDWEWRNKNEEIRMNNGWGGKAEGRGEEIWNIKYKIWMTSDEWWMMNGEIYLVYDCTFALLSFLLTWLIVNNVIYNSAKCIKYSARNGVVNIYNW